MYEPAVAEEEALPEPEAAPAPKGETVCWVKATLGITPTAALGQILALRTMSCYEQKAAKVLLLHVVAQNQAVVMMHCMDTVRFHDTALALAAQSLLQSKV